MNLPQIGRLPAAALAVIACVNVASAQNAAPPECPSDSSMPSPAFADIGRPPTVAFWSNLASLPGNCAISLKAPVELTIALAGSFIHTGTVEDIAARLGAISNTRDILYWSVSDESWRKLISEAVALDSANPKDSRSDFSGQEVLSGQTLYFSQNDTSSWGTNLYTSKVLESSADHLVFASQNSSPIRLGPVTIFKPEEAQSVLFINRLKDTSWTVFSLSVIKKSGLPMREKSLINRQVAFYRLLTGERFDKEPPVAP